MLGPLLGSIGGHVGGLGSLLGQLRLGLGAIGLVLDGHGVALLRYHPQPSPSIPVPTVKDVLTLLKASNLAIDLAEAATLLAE